MATPQDRLLPSASAYAIATVILVFVGGYFIGQGVSLGVFRRSSPGASKESWPNSYDVKVHADSSDEQGGGSSSSSSDDDDDEVEDEEGEEEGARGERESFDGNDEECKLVLVVRTDLGMGKGKIAAQCSHATLACYKDALTHTAMSSILRRWERTGQAKVALQVASEAELETLRARARGLGLCAQVVRDAGRTQVASGSATVLGVGPGPRSVVDRVTGGLKLL